MSGSHASPNASPSTLPWSGWRSPGQLSVASGRAVPVVVEHAAVGRVVARRSGRRPRRSAQPSPSVSAGRPVERALDRRVGLEPRAARPSRRTRLVATAEPRMISLSWWGVQARSRLQHERGDGRHVRGGHRRAVHVVVRIAAEVEDRRRAASATGTVDAIPSPGAKTSTARVAVVRERRDAVVVVGRADAEDVRLGRVAGVDRRRVVVVALPSAPPLPALTTNSVLDAPWIASRSVCEAPSPPSEALTIGTLLSPAQSNASAMSESEPLPWSLSTRSAAMRALGRDAGDAFAVVVLSGDRPAHVRAVTVAVVRVSGSSLPTKFCRPCRSG